MEDVLLVVVFFNPTVDQVIKFNNVAQKNNVVVVDNTSKELQCNRTFNYIPLRDNKGIAVAQNCGINYAMKNGFKYTVFFDQDSDVNNEYVERLVSEYKKIKKIDNSIAILGPVLVDGKSGVEYKNYLKNDMMYKKTDAIISSGSIVETRFFSIVGGMDESMFIDLVDFEWCWRASKYGFSTYISRNIEMYHSIGKEYHRYGPFVVGLSSAHRYYYQYRNTLWMLRREYVPSIWKLKSCGRRLLDLLVLPFLFKEKRAILLAIFKGIMDGFKRQKCVCDIFMN